MKELIWKDGKKDNVYYAVTKIADDGGITSSKLNSMVQQWRSVVPAQCNNGQLRVNKLVVNGDYDFYIYANSQEAVDNSKIIIKEFYKNCNVNKKEKL